MNTSQQLEFIKRNTVEIIPENELLDKLNFSEKSKKPLRVKLGIDPTAPDMHLGNAVVLRKLREFQELGHIALLIVGDFTAKIGDPSGRSKTRPQITNEEIEKNMATYKEQIFKILIPEKTEFRYNSEWLGKLTSEEIIKLASKFTLAQLLEREEISNRYKNNEPISLHELFYAIFQGYDSVATMTDIELGATEQKFNLLVGRELQREYFQAPQVTMTMPILVGTDGVKKMSKSYGNYIGITETPVNMFGKVMSIPDSCIMNYFQLATNLPEVEIKNIEQLLKSSNPRDIKSRLGYEIVKVYHSEAEAKEAEQGFVKMFSKKEVPEDMRVYEVKEEKIWLPQLLLDSGAVPTKSEARRLIEQKAVEVDGQVVTDIKFELEVKSPVVLKVGKRQFLKVILVK
ncbi:MAG: tyrosine--tRNA ligase [bacterium]|nr:tyrosine--tRNA ligase [bacterium]